MATTSELLVKVNAAIEALIDSPEVDYTRGDVSVSAGQKMKQLLELRAELLARPDAEITLMPFACGNGEFGESLRETIT